MKVASVILSLVMTGCLTGCCTCPPKTSVTTKPDVRPVVESNKKIRESSSKIRTSNDKSLKLNKDIQGDLDSASKELDNLLKK